MGLPPTALRMEVKQPAALEMKRYSAIGSMWVNGQGMPCRIMTPALTCSSLLKVGATGPGFA